MCRTIFFPPVCTTAGELTGYPYFFLDRFMSWIHVMHFTCPGGQAVMIICSTMYLFIEPYKWILWGRQKSHTWVELTSLCGLYTNNYAQGFFSICYKGIANNNWKTLHKKPHFWHIWNKVTDVICKSFQDHGWWVYCWKIGRNGFFINASPSSWQKKKNRDAYMSIVCCPLCFLPLLISQFAQDSLYGSSSSLQEQPFAAGHCKLLIQASEGPHRLALVCVRDRNIYRRCAW